MTPALWFLAGVLLGGVLGVFALAIFIGGKESPSPADTRQNGI